MPRVLSERDPGLIVGLLVGQGRFGGDGRQPHVTLKMHIRHEALFRWLESRVPGLAALRALRPRRPPLLPVDGARPGARRAPPSRPRGAHHPRARRARSRASHHDDRALCRRHRPRSRSELALMTGRALARLLSTHALPADLAVPCAAARAARGPATPRPPSTIRRRALDVHVADSLVALEVPELRAARPHRRHRLGRRASRACRSRSRCRARACARREPPAQVRVPRSARSRRSG